MKKKILAAVLAAAVLVALISVGAMALGGLLTPEEPAPTALSGIAAGPGGTLLVSDSWNKVLWLKAEDGSADLFAGKVPVEDLSGEPVGVYADGDAADAMFGEPWAIVPYRDGYLVSDRGANVIRYVANGQVLTAAGSGKEGSANGPANEASFSAPTGLAVGDDGEVYIADTGNGRIRRLDPDGTVRNSLSGLESPTGLCWADGTLYICETGKNRICKVENGSLVPIAGMVQAAENAGEYYGAFWDGYVEGAAFDHPQGIQVGEDGSIYVADTLNHAVRLIRDGKVYTLARNDLIRSVPYAPRALMVQDGKLVVADGGSGELLEIELEKDYGDAALNDAALRGLFAQFPQEEISAGQAITAGQLASLLGNAALYDDGSLVIDGEAQGVPEDKWYSAAARWAVAEGIASGDSDWEAPVSAQDAGEMLRAFADRRGVKFGETLSGDGITQARAAEILCAILDARQQ